jgi:hypothetical protein
MPPPTASLKPAPKQAGNKDKTPSTTLNAPAAQVDKADKLAKPDQVVYNKEQDEINKEIEGVKAKLVSARRRAQTMMSGGHEIERAAEHVPSTTPTPNRMKSVTSSPSCILPLETRMIVDLRFEQRWMLYKVLKVKPR